MRHGLLFATILLSSVTLIAQQPGAGAPAVFVAPPQSLNCPVGIDARRQSGLAMRQIDDKQKPEGQTLDLTFNRRQVPTIAGIHLVVHGYSTAPVMLPVTHSGYPGLSESFTLQLKNGAAKLVHARLQTEKIGVISWLELKQIDYANGTRWQASQQSQCRAAPNLLLLTAER